MSMRALAAALKNNAINDGDFRALVLLADIADDTGHCCPTMASLAQKMGKSPRTVKRHISSLAGAGLIERIERRRTDGSRISNLYRLQA